MANHRPAAEALARLTRLEQYLREDPNNLPLLEDAFNVAFAAGEWERARFHLRHAAALGVTGHTVDFREAHLDLAAHRWQQARARLESMRAAPGLPVEARDAVAHDLAYAAFRQGDLDGSHAVLAPLMEPVEARPTPAQQILWLRLLHHAGRLEDAVEWVRSRISSDWLVADASGVASLAALDLGQLDVAQAWATAALRENSQLLEALVALGTVALARRNPTQARAALRGALEVHPRDGRAWSALGFVDLLEQQLDAAIYDFHQAVQSMPDHIGTWNGMGWTNIVRRDMEAAAQAFERAIALDRNFGESHGGLAVAYAFLGRREEAEQAIERANGLDRTNLASQYASAVLGGDARDVQTIQRLAVRLLSRRAGPAGGTMADWLPPVVEATREAGDTGQ
ncbi:tetratricopeptide repeat protein [Cupriavidus sp. 30B13]|uniref:tetratricopeptide repeat protein n=1 Tax=Cupriavidus sp. 30B13 TaxID=3384241 RepID=UPI003B8EFA47